MQLLAENEPAKAQAELEKSREFFTRLSTQGGHWTVPVPVEMKTESGARLELQEDGSVFAHQDHPGRFDTYSLVFTSEMKGIKGLRVEALADSRLPGGGPGWASNGNITLDELTLLAASAQSRGKARPIALRNAWADFNQAGWDVRAAIDGDDSTAWGVHPEFHKDLEAVFDLAEEVGDGQALRLTVQLKQGISGDDKVFLGRFRVSFTSDVKTLEATRSRLDLKGRELVDFFVALGKAYALQGETNQAVASFTEALPFAADRAGEAKIIAEAEALDGVLEKLRERAASDGPFQAALARHHVDHGNAPLADLARTKARAVFEEKLANEPENSAWVAELADVLLVDTKHWTVLKPTEMKSAGGATLTLQPAGSVLASGTNPDRDVYSMVAKNDLKQITAIRLEALPHPTLPHNGPGRFPNNGNFYLFDLRVFSGGAPVPLTDITVAYDEFQNSRSVIDGRLDSRGWGNAEWAGKKNTAVIATRLERAADDDLKIEICSSSLGGQHNLGCFRLAFTDDPVAFEHESERLAAMKLTDPWVKLAAAYLVIGDQKALDKLVKRHPAAAAALGNRYAADKDWERAIAEYRKAITDQTTDAVLLTNFAKVYQEAGRTREAVPYLARVSAADPRDTLLSPKVAALQASFGQKQELAATRQRVLAFARGTNDASTAGRASFVCSFVPSTDETELGAALDLGRAAVKLGNGVGWHLLDLGAAEYRNGNDIAAEKALLEAAKAGPNNDPVMGISSFFRAMSLFCQWTRILTKLLDPNCYAV
ncbi:MAG: tetratricopeptide repeat protein [Isosphaerales bacterium]